MEFQIELYHFEGPDIRISVDAYFRDEDLIIDGYDIGKRVEAYWGDSDYEYITTIPAEEVKKLYLALLIEAGNKTALLSGLSRRFSTNSCYSDLRNFLDQQGIRYESFSWT